jgi:K+-transporting ATPase ATPase B chain
VFVFAVASIPSFASYAGGSIPVIVLVALFVTLIPTTIGALLSAIGIAGMDRLVRFNVLAMSGRAVEAAGDVDTLLLDKTGTITLGNRQATEFRPVSRRDRAGTRRRGATRLARRRDAGGPLDRGAGQGEVRHPRPRHGRAQRHLRAVHRAVADVGRRPGERLDPQGRGRRRDRVAVRSTGGEPGLERRPGLQPAPETGAVKEIRAIAEEIAKAGGTPLAVAKDGRLLGVVYLKDIVKGGIRERFAELRQMGIRTVMITGDNPMTAAAIAAEAGVDDFLAQATPEDKLALIRKEQAEGKLVAMCGDGTNDAPALAQADVGVAMNTGTVAAREAGNMVDLDSDPTKLIEIVGIGKQLLMTRGALTTFSIANDVAKYFAIIPAMFLALYPQLQALNIMGLASPQSAILSAIIFNALIIVALIPLALKGCHLPGRRRRPRCCAGTC